MRRFNELADALFWLLVICMLVSVAVTIGIMTLDLLKGGC